MITATDVKGWNRYHGFEGPVYYGTLKVPIAPNDASFDQKVLSLTSAAEGNYDSVNMWDAGICSVGAIQFIDRAPQLSVSDMLGFVAERVGIDLVVEALRPALTLCDALFYRVPSHGRWRFSLNGRPVEDRTSQAMLYFGDVRGNARGSFDDQKKLRARTWCACMSNVWHLEGATVAQAEFTLPRLVNGFVWGKLKEDLYTGTQQDDGVVGMTRAMLLAFCVNAPAVVVHRYATYRDNGEDFKSIRWCEKVLRGVVCGSGIDVWPARWRAQRTMTEAMFGVILPPYEKLCDGTGEFVPVVEPEIEESVVVSPHEDLPTPTRDDIDVEPDRPEPSIKPIPTPIESPPNWWSFILETISLLIARLSRRA